MTKVQFFFIILKCGGAVSLFEENFGVVDGILKTVICGGRYCEM